jgi:fimbrial chaperone protein
LTALTMPIRPTSLFLLAGALLSTVPAFAAEFAIVPLRVFLDRSARTTQVEIRNVGTDPLRMQVQAMSWAQDADGKDQYADPGDLIYFPRALDVPPNEARIVRLGVKASPTEREDTYRVFFEELALAEQTPPAQPSATGASVRILLRVGVPVFIAPLQPKPQGEIASVDVKSGAVQFVLVNAGNVHFAAEVAKVTGFDRNGAEVFSKTLQERYLLAGVRRPIREEIPRELCARVAAVEVVFAGENVDLQKRLEVVSGAC